MFSVHLLPAQQGDAIWIEYGDARAPNRILIDCGTPPTADIVRRRVDQLPPDQRSFELLVVTHIDTDHIGGVLKLLANRPAGLVFGDVWFNAWRHLEKLPSSKMGPIDGEILSTALDKLKWPWNEAFGGGAVCTVAEADGLPTRKLPGGMSLTVLSPGHDQLRKLRSNWRTVVRDAGLDPDRPDRDARLLQRANRKGVSSSILGSPRPDVRRLAAKPADLDTAVANGSSIALLIEYEGKRVLLCADGFPELILSSIRQLQHKGDGGQIRVDAVKVPHHGSRNNLTTDLLAAIQASRYLFSTSGAIFGHPDDEAVARIIWAKRRSRPQLYFNYPKDARPIRPKSRSGAASKEWSALKWDDPVLKRAHRYEAAFAGSIGTVIELEP